MPPSASTAVPACYRHPSIERTSRCGLCGRAICDQCLLRTPNGISCPDCNGVVQPEATERGLLNRGPIPFRAPAAAYATRRQNGRWRRLGIFAVVATVAIGGAWFVAERMSPERVAAAVPVTTSGNHKFMNVESDLPITYDPCRPIRYQLNLDEAPPGSEAVLGSALDEVERATGLKFEYVGTTRQKPLDKEPLTYRLGIKNAPPVTISWATPEEAPLLAGDVAGYAGSSYKTIDGRPTHYITGRVILDADTYARLVQSPDGTAEARAITMHELGHLVGLDHVDDRTELMYPENTGQLNFGPGDLAGLAQLGSGEC